MLIIENKVIEEIKLDLLKLQATPSPNDHIQSSAMFAESRIELIEKLSKEVEVLDMAKVHNDWVCDEAWVNFDEYLKEKGYQLIKVVEK